VSLSSTHTRSLHERTRHLLATGHSELGELAARSLLADVVPFGAAISCQTPEEAVSAAEEIGYPVVVKGLSPQILHKSDHGLVVVGCLDADSVRAAATAVQARILAVDRGGATISVQAQLSGAEFAIGIRRDTLGPVCMVAAGGTLIELLNDTAFGMAPLRPERARVMLESLRADALLDGYRGQAAADRDALVELLVELSRAIAEVPEISELDLNPIFVGEDGAFVADARCVLTPAPAAAARDGARDASAVRAILEPRRIAVVGASRERTKVGGLVLHYLLKHGWPGEVIAVNPKPLELDGVTAAASVAEIDREVDLACIAVPGPHVEGVVRDCVAAGIPSGIIYSSGFSEIGPEGEAAQARVVEAAAGRFRFVGPNSIGAASPTDRLYAAFGMALEAEDIPAGSVGFVSQSGAIASSLISRSAEFGVGFSRWISAGNEADLGLADYVEYLAADDATRVICLFVEAVRRPRAFRAACEAALRAGKPVIALKTGRSEAGRAAAASHTGALTGSEAAYSAFFEELGVIEVASLPALMCAAQGLLSVGPVVGARTGVISMSGGACSLIADACAAVGLETPPLPDEAQEALRRLLPSFGAVRNPVDVTAQGINNPQLVRHALDIMRASGAYDIVLVQLSTNADPAAADIADGLIDAREAPGVPFLVGRLGAPALAAEAMRRYTENGMHVFSWPEQLVDAAAACVRSGALRCFQDGARAA
jgi:acetate---CoA ligase (ADP-forming)